MAASPPQGHSAWLFILPQVLVEGPGLQGQLPELLATAVGTSPQLRSLSLNGVWEGRSILKGVSGLSNLTELVLETWEFPSSGDVTEMRYLSGLKSLEASFCR